MNNRCLVCHGKGQNPFEPDQPCVSCRGTGKWISYQEFEDRAEGADFTTLFAQYGALIEYAEELEQEYSTLRRVHDESMVSLRLMKMCFSRACRKLSKYTPGKSAGAWYGQLLDKSISVLDKE